MKCLEEWNTNNMTLKITFLTPAVKIRIFFKMAAAKMSIPLIVRVYVPLYKRDMHDKVFMIDF